MSELKPCPFCGATNIVKDSTVLRGKGKGWNWIQCHSCSAQSDVFVTIDEAIAAWNRRTPAAPSPAAGEAVIRPKYGPGEIGPHGLVPSTMTLSQQLEFCQTSLRFSQERCTKALEELVKLRAAPPAATTGSK